MGIGGTIVEEETTVRALRGSRLVIAAISMIVEFPFMRIENNWRSVDSKSCQTRLDYYCRLDSTKIKQLNIVAVLSRE